MKRRLFILISTLALLLLTGCDSIIYAASLDKVENELRQAISFGSLEWVKECIEKGVTINGEGAFNFYEYAISVEAKGVILDCLLESGADLNYIRKTGLSPLMGAAASNSVESCRDYISFGADIDMVSEEGYTALDYAASYGSEETTEYLLSVGNMPTTKTVEAALAYKTNDGSGWRAFGIIRRLVTRLEKGEIESLFTPAVLEAILGNSDAVLTQLQAGGVEKEELTRVGFYASAFCTPAVLEECVRQGFHLIHQDEYYQPLQVAAQYGNAENVRWMIEHWTQYETETQLEMPLSTAAVKGQFEVVSLLLDLGAQIAPYEQEGVHLTALSAAAQNGDMEMLELLLGSNQTIAHSALGQAAAQAIRWDKWDAAIRLLAEDTWSEIELRSFSAESLRNVDMLRELHAYGADQSDDDLLLSLAAQYGYDDATEYLLSLGSDPNSFEEHSEPPLVYAVRYGHLDVVQLLLENGADPNLPSAYTDIPLHTAVMSSFRITEALIASGADINHTLESGETLLMTACMNGRLECAKLLIDAGIDVSAVDNKGKSAKDYAAAYGDPDIIALFAE